jgi:hypothetical protein
MPLRTLVLNSGPFPPPELPGFDGTAGLSATPDGPAWPSRASGWPSRTSTAGASRVVLGLRVPACRRQYPGGTTGSCRFTRHGPHFPSDGGLPRYVGGSAPSSLLSGPAQRSLALRPACSPSRLRGPLSRRLRRFRYLCRRSDSFRLERLSSPGGTRTHWNNPHLFTSRNINPIIGTRIVNFGRTETAPARHSGVRDDGAASGAAAFLGRPRGLGPSGDKPRREETEATQSGSPRGRPVQAEARRASNSASANGSATLTRQAARRAAS